MYCRRRHPSQPTVGLVVVGECALRNIRRAFRRPRAYNTAIRKRSELVAGVLGHCSDSLLLVANLETQGQHGESMIGLPHLLVLFFASLMFQVRVPRSRSR